VEFIQQLVNHQDRECVLDRYRVQGPVVDAKAPQTIGLLDEEDRQRERRVAAVDNPLFDHGGTLSLQFVLVGSQVPVRADSDRLCVGLQQDAVVASVLWGQACWHGEDPYERVEEGLQ
jgi:hypothetical protein